MSKVAEWFNPFKTLFLMIAEPRVVRLIHFGIYLCLLLAGAGIIYSPPGSFQSVLGVSLVYVFGGFILLGAFVAAFAVLPGIWWLERVGLLSLITGMAMYIVILIDLRPSPVGMSISVAFILTFLLRWIDIKGSLLAPRED